MCLVSSTCDPEIVACAVGIRIDPEIIVQDPVGIRSIHKEIVYEPAGIVSCDCLIVSLYQRDPGLCAYRQERVPAGSGTMTTRSLNHRSRFGMVQAAC